MNYGVHCTTFLRHCPHCPWCVSQTSFPKRQNKKQTLAPVDYSRVLQQHHIRTRLSEMTATEYSESSNGEVTTLEPENQHPSSKEELSPPQLPEWAHKTSTNEWGERLEIPEWENGNYRVKNDWKGQDLVHGTESPVRIYDYFVKYGEGFGTTKTINEKGGVGTALTGIAYFSEKAESHRGFCHGGSMCSLLDDVVGWCSFLVTGKCVPWSGYTVQINSSLKKPVPIRSFLKITATIVKIERRKVFVNASIVDPVEESEHATCEGLVVLNRGVLPIEGPMQ